MKKTDIGAVKDIAIQLIYIKPEPTEDFNFWIHPYINNSAILLPNEDKPFSIFHDLESYRIWQELFAEEIRQRKNAERVSSFV